jgi:hypothetical protein
MRKAIKIVVIGFIGLSIIGAIAGCSEVKTGKSIASANEAQVAFLEIFNKEAHVHPTTAGASCTFGGVLSEGEWKCEAHGFSGANETSECKTESGTVTKGGVVKGDGVLGGAASECGKAAAAEEGAGQKETQQATAVNPIWTAEETTACDHEDAATGRLSASCIATMKEVCATAVDEASSEVVADEETMKANACKMEALGAVVNNAQEGENE